MGSSRNIPVIALAAMLLIGPAGRAAAQDPPPPPILSDAETRCQKTVNDATIAYFNASFNARHDCFLLQLNGKIALPPEVDCRASAEFGTGDPTTDDRLLRAQANLLADISTKCLTVDLANLGFPGFCPGEYPTPMTVFDLDFCLQTAAEETLGTLLDYEQPPVVMPLETNQDQICQDTVSRKSSNMFTGELETRQNCTLKVLERTLDYVTVDCRAEQEFLAPDTGNTQTDNDLIEAHNKVLRNVPNSCPRRDLSPLGFPNICPFRAGDVYPLTELYECMFNSHHFGTFRMLDITNPLTTQCGDGHLNFAEQCDDGDMSWMPGEVCRFNCSVITQCADTNDDGMVTVTDALFILRAAVGSLSCQVEICDANGDGELTATDALVVLRKIVGLGDDLMCPLPLLSCGNGIVDFPAETCDDGDRFWNFGQQCNASCQQLLCGDPNDSGTITAADARFILRAALSLETCDLEVCDVDNDGKVGIGDALRVLAIASGNLMDLNCPLPPTDF